MNSKPQGDAIAIVFSFHGLLKSAIVSCSVSIRTFSI